MTSTHHPACAVVRCGELRAWCDCGKDEAKKIMEDLLFTGMVVIQNGRLVSLDDVFIGDPNEPPAIKWSKRLDSVKWGEDDVG